MLPPYCLHPQRKQTFESDFVSLRQLRHQRFLHLACGLQVQVSRSGILHLAKILISIRLVHGSSELTQVFSKLFPRDFIHASSLLRYLSPQ